MFFFVFVFCVDGHTKLAPNIFWRTQKWRFYCKHNVCMLSKRECRGARFFPSDAGREENKPVKPPRRGSVSRDPKYLGIVQP